MAKYGVKKIGVIRCGNGLSTPPKFSLKDGLVKTIQWFVENHKIEGKVSRESLLEHI